MIRNTNEVLASKRPVRESEKISDFKRLGVLDDVDEVLPDADRVSTDDELVESICFPARRRVSTLIHLHPELGRPDFAQISAIKSNEPDASLIRGPVKITIGRDANQEPLQETKEFCREADDRQAIERGEGEGMIVGRE